MSKIYPEIFIDQQRKQPPKNLLEAIIVIEASTKTPIADLITQFQKKQKMHLLLSSVFKIVPIGLTLLGILNSSSPILGEIMQKNEPLVIEGAISIAIIGGLFHYFFSIQQQNRVEFLTILQSEKTMNHLQLIKEKVKYMIV